MDPIVAAIIAALSSSGVCSIVLYLIQRKDRKAEQTYGKILDRLEKIEGRISDIEEQDKKRDTALIAQLHSSIYHTGQEILTQYADGRRTCIDIDDFHDLSIMYQAYSDLGGNGTCKILFDKISTQIPLKQTNRMN